MRPDHHCHWDVHQYSVRNTYPSSDDDEDGGGDDDGGGGGDDDDDHKDGASGGDDVTIISSSLGCSSVHWHCSKRVFIMSCLY